MPDLSTEITAQIDGEGELDLILQRQVADARAGKSRRELPQEFVQRVYYSAAYAIRIQNINGEALLQRVRHIEEYLENFRTGNRFETFVQSIVKRVGPEYQEIREEANQRAEKLLKSLLSPEQLKEFEHRGYFHVTAKNRRFRITMEITHNVKEVDSRGRILRTYCIHPKDHVPKADAMVVKKLLLEAMPEEFFKVANMRRRLHGHKSLPLPHPETEEVRRLAQEMMAGVYSQPRALEGNERAT